MHERERALHALVAQILVELLELRRGQHALVDQRAAREAREVDGVVDVVGRCLDFVLNPLAHDERMPLQRQIRESVLGDEHLTE